MLLSAARVSWLKGLTVDPPVVEDGFELPPPSAITPHQPPRRRAPPRPRHR